MSLNKGASIWFFNIVSGDSGCWNNEYRIALKSLARRYLELHDEIADLDVMIAAIVDELAPELIKRNAIGYESASQLLITAGDNPQRLRSESGFAALCGVSLVPYLLEKRTVTD